MGGHDDEGNHGHVGTSSLHSVVQASQRLNEHVYTLIAVFVATGGEEVESLVGIKVVVTIEVTSHEIIDPLLADLMQVLELVSGGELLDIQTVGQNTVRLALEEMLALVGGDVRDGGEDIGGVGGTAFNAVSVVDASLSGLGITVEVLEVVVEINRACAEVATEKSGVSGEDCGDVDPSLLAKGEGHTCKPLVELCNNGAFFLVENVLFSG